MAPIHQPINQKRTRVNGATPTNFTGVERIVHLAADIIEVFLDGTRPPHMTAKQLILIHKIPIDWAEQRKAPGFPST